MADPFDIFEVESKDAVRWLGAAATLVEAHATIRRMGSGVSGRYIVIDQKTGRKLNVEQATVESKSRAIAEANIPNQGRRRAANA
jgi:hypothetical protein